MQLYLFPLYILLGILPSAIWLLYYLKKDLHPEPKKMIVKIFFYGALATVPVFFIQLGLSWLLQQLPPFALFESYPMILPAVKWFLVIALTEELFKYGVVKWHIFDSSALDEPLDIMLYMVVVALGFAAVENMLYLFSSVYNIVSFDAMISTAVAVLIIRFIGATFLHTLCSALVGYFIAMASLYNKKRVLLVLTGLLLAVAFHGLYDFSIVILPQPFNVIIPAVLILILSLFMLYDFNEIKKIKSICKL
ncbi:PrsW family intramembrane metalloprotease [Candidatus Parcubacteria bacterium]|nr:PrsW family intramembrane metalloprotease [Candidatus Parcubacteria bacterium]